MAFLGLILYKVSCLWFVLLSSIPFLLPLVSYHYTMSSPSSSYVQVGLDNLERPLNCSPSPRAQVRGLIGLLLIYD